MYIICEMRLQLGGEKGRGAGGGGVSGGGGVFMYCIAVIFDHAALLD